MGGLFFLRHENGARTTGNLTAGAGLRGRRAK